MGILAKLVLAGSLAWWPGWGAGFKVTNRTNSDWVLMAGDDPDWALFVWDCQADTCEAVLTRRWQTCTLRAGRAYHFDFLDEPREWRSQTIYLVETGGSRKGTCRFSVCPDGLAPFHPLYSVQLTREASFLQVESFDQVALR